MPSTQRSAVWGFILLLGALAFLRSLAPERTERAMHHLLSTHGRSKDAINQREKHLKHLKEELERERAALQRWKEELDQQREELKAAGLPEVGNERKVSESADDLARAVNEEDPDVFSDADREKGALQPHENSSTERDENGTDSNKANAEVSDNGEHLKVHGDVEEPIPELTDEECPNIVVPEFTRAGLGTQVIHLWSSLSITLALRNSCMVIPPILADDGMENFRPVPFYQVFDEEVLARTGLRFVPLRTCQKHGVSTVFDDSGAESAVVKNFAAFVQESHPKLAEESTLVHGHSKGYRFESADKVNGDVNVLAEYVRSHLPSEPGRHCIGVGRMRPQIEINSDVLKYLSSAPSIAEYVMSKFPDVNETLFVRLRWNQAVCEKVRAQTGTICIFSDHVVPIDEYVYSIAHTAASLDASQIYISTPSHIPEDVSSVLASRLRSLDPVLLDVDGDFFMANVIERELAIRARGFVSDGGIWDESVMLSKKTLYPEYIHGELNSITIIQAWREAGSPIDLPLMNIVQGSEQGGEKSTVSASPTEMAERQPEPANTTGDSSLNSIEKEPESGPSPQFVGMRAEPDSNQQNTSILGKDLETFFGGNETQDAIPSSDAPYVLDAGRVVEEKEPTEARPAEYAPPADYVPNDIIDEKERLLAESVARRTS